MSKTIIAALIAFALLTGAAVSWLVQKNKTYVIHFVNYRGHTDVDKGFEESMKKRGINMKLTYHDVQREPKNFPIILSKIRADPDVDLVITWGTTTTLGIFGKYSDGEPFIKNKPGVFTLVTDPLSSEIISKKNDEHRNITGAWHIASVEKQFTTMMLYKAVKKMGVLYSPTESNSVVTLVALRSFGESFNVEIIPIPFDVVDGKVNSRNTIDALNVMQAAGVEWLYLPPDSYLGTQAEKLVIPEAHKRGMATFASTEQLMQAGACVGLVSTYMDLGYLLAEQTEKILIDKVPPSKIDVTSVNRFQHQINLNIALQFGIKPPKGLESEIVNVGK